MPFCFLPITKGIYFAIFPNYGQHTWRHTVQICKIKTFRGYHYLKTINHKYLNDRSFESKVTEMESLTPKVLYWEKSKNFAWFYLTLSGWKKCMWPKMTEFESSSLSLTSKTAKRVGEWYHEMVWTCSENFLDNNDRDLGQFDKTKLLLFSMRIHFDFFGQDTQFLLNFRKNLVVLLFKISLGNLCYFTCLFEKGDSKGISVPTFMILLGTIRKGWVF